jgi:hypothetical protein
MSSANNTRPNRGFDDLAPTREMNIGLMPHDKNTAAPRKAQRAAAAQQLFTPSCAASVVNQGEPAAAVATDPSACPELPSSREPPPGALSLDDSGPAHAANGAFAHGIEDGGASFASPGLADAPNGLLGITHARAGAPRATAEDHTADPPQGGCDAEGTLVRKRAGYFVLVSGPPRAPPHGVPAAAIAGVTASTVMTGFAEWKRLKDKISCAENCDVEKVLGANTVGKMARHKLTEYRTTFSNFVGGITTAKDKHARNSVGTFLELLAPLSWATIAGTLVLEFDGTAARLSKTDANIEFLSLHTTPAAGLHHYLVIGLLDDGQLVMTPLLTEGENSDNRVPVNIRIDNDSPHARSYFYPGQMLSRTLDQLAPLVCYAASRKRPRIEDRVRRVQCNKTVEIAAMLNIARAGASSSSSSTGGGAA